MSLASSRPAPMQATRVGKRENAISAGVGSEAYRAFGSKWLTVSCLWFEVAYRDPLVVAYLS